MIAIGTLLRFNPVPAQQSVDVPSGTMGIFIGYHDDTQGYLSGFEPINVLFLNGIHKIYLDEVDIIE